MRYITNSSGYLQEVSFGAEITCNGQSCAEYTGTVPTGYNSLEAWYIAECDTLYRWKIVDGDLVEDTSVAEPVENDLYVGPRARLRTTADGRGNLQLFKADGTLAVNAYANGSGGGGEIDLCDATGSVKAELCVGTDGAGYLALRDADGNQSILTAEQIASIGSGSGGGVNPYPVGSIYLSVVSTSPASLFGGTWERLKDVFLLAAGDAYAAGATGGEAEHTLTEDEMPSHKHIMYVEYSSASAWRPKWTMYMTSGSWGQVWEDDGRSGFSTWSVNAAGGSAAHNNMPPYLAVYMWRRTA